MVRGKDSRKSHGKKWKQTTGKNANAFSLAFSIASTLFFFLLLLLLRLLLPSDSFVCFSFLFFSLCFLFFFLSTSFLLPFSTFPRFLCLGLKPDFQEPSTPGGPQLRYRSVSSPKWSRETRHVPPKGARLKLLHSHSMAHGENSRSGCTSFSFQDMNK